MRRSLTLPTLIFAVVVPVTVRAQSAGPAAQPTASPGYASTQPLAARAYWLSLLQLYGLQSAASATPATRAELAQAMQEYFTNGAAVTGVPSAGPSAAYFARGADVSTVPTSVIPDYSFSPAFPAETRWTPDAGVAGPSEAGAAAPASSSSPADAAAPGSMGGALPSTPTSALTGTSNPASDAATVPNPPTGWALSPTLGSPPASASAAETAPPSASGTPAGSWTSERGRVGVSEYPSGTATAATRETPAIGASAVLVPMAIGVALAGLLVALGLRIRPTTRR